MAREVRMEREVIVPPPVVPTAVAAELVARAGLDKKAEDVVLLDVRGLSSYADFLVLMTASSDRQVSAVADAVDEQLRRCGHRPIGVEGQGAGSWILIDAGDLVVHVFHSEARGFYDLDGLWADARRMAVPVDAPRPALA